MRHVSRLAAAVALALAVSCGGEAGDSSPGAAASTSASSSAAASTAPAPAAASSESAAAEPTSAAPPSAPASTIAASPAAEPDASPSSSPAADAEPPEAATGTCALLTAVEVAAALDVPVSSGHFTDAGFPFGNKICSWSTESLPARVYTLSLQRTADMAPAMVKAGGGAPKLFGQAANLQRQKAGSIERVTGIGSEAFIVGTAIFAIKGDTFITANTQYSDGTDSVDAVTSLTRLAVSRL